MQDRQSTLSHIKVVYFKILFLNGELDLLLPDSGCPLQVGTGHGLSGQSLCSKDVTTHPHLPGARPDRPVLHHLLWRVVGGVDILLDVISGVESTMMMIPFNCSCRNNNLKHGSNYLYSVNKRPFFGNCVITPYGVITSHVFSKCVTGCRWSGYPVKRDWWGGKRDDDDAF